MTSSMIPAATLAQTLHHPQDTPVLRALSGGLSASSPLKNIPSMWPFSVCGFRG